MVMGGDTEKLSSPSVEPATENPVESPLEKPAGH
jgi:hypothetical protein